MNDKTENTKKQKPFHELRFAGVRGTIWKNQTSQGFTKFAATFSKLFWDQEARQWRDSSSYDAKDLPQLIRVAELVYDFLHSAAVKEEAEEKVVGV